MSDKRIIDLEAKQTLGSGDYLAADSAQGTYKVDANTNIMTPLTNVRNNVANSSASPDKYSSSTAYKVGDMVIHDDILYKCTTACSAASWAVNSACFTATTLASVVTQLNSDLTTLYDVIDSITFPKTYGITVTLTLFKSGMKLLYLFGAPTQTMSNTIVASNIPDKYLPTGDYDVRYLTQTIYGILRGGNNKHVTCNGSGTFGSAYVLYI